VEIALIMTVTANQQSHFTCNAMKRIRALLWVANSILAARIFQISRWSGPTSKTPAGRKLYQRAKIKRSTQETHLVIDATPQINKVWLASVLKPPAIDDHRIH
jgi:hypothetical protein